MFHTDTGCFESNMNS